MAASGLLITEETNEFGVTGESSLKLRLLVNQAQEEPFAMCFQRRHIESETKTENQQLKH